MWFFLPLDVEGGFKGVLGVALNFVHPLRASHASPSLGEGEENGVLCFTLDSRVRWNDGGAGGNDDVRLAE